MIVDPGHLLTPMYQEPGLERLLAEMHRDGLDDARIGLVILTHGHPDHCEAASPCARNTGPWWRCTRRTRPNFESMGGKVDVFLEEGSLELDSGDSRYRSGSSIPPGIRRDM